MVGKVVPLYIVCKNLKLFHTLTAAMHVAATAI